MEKKEFTGEDIELRKKANSILEKHRTDLRNFKNLNPSCAELYNDDFAVISAMVELVQSLSVAKEPSDEEIKLAAIRNNILETDGFIDGAKWMRSQLPSRNDAVEFAVFVRNNCRRIAFKKMYNSNKEQHYSYKGQQYTTQELYDLFKGGNGG